MWCKYILLVKLFLVSKIEGRKPSENKKREPLGETFSFHVTINIVAERNYFCIEENCRARCCAYFSR